jgi:hypothetical protein
MKAFRRVVVLTAIVCSGCDAWYARHLQIENGYIGAHHNTAREEVVLVAVRSYAHKNKIPCRDQGTLPIECWFQPIRIWAVREGNKISVCYSGMGLPVEASRFRDHMDELQTTLELGASSEEVTVTEAQCPKPPYGLNNGFDAKSPN